MESKYQDLDFSTFFYLFISLCYTLSFSLYLSAPKFRDLLYAQFGKEETNTHLPTNCYWNSTVLGTRESLLTVFTVSQTPW